MLVCTEYGVLVCACGRVVGKEDGRQVLKKNARLRRTNEYSVQGPVGRSARLGLGAREWRDGRYHFLDTREENEPCIAVYLV